MEVQVVRICPMWVAPNLLTFVGFLCCVGHFLLLTVFDYSFTAGTAPPEIRSLLFYTRVCSHLNSNLKLKKEN
jgi:hypothetical protein